jgi:hypothetical protein
MTAHSFSKRPSLSRRSQGGVKCIMGNMDPEADLTWEQALAEFETATPAEVVRAPQRIEVIYQYLGGRWRAFSPNLTGFDASGASLRQVREVALTSLRSYLHSAVELRERYWHPWLLTTHVLSPIVSTGLPLTITADVGAATTSVRITTDISCLPQGTGPTVTVGEGITVIHTTTFTSWPETRGDESMTVVLGEAPNAMAGAA